MCRCFTPRRQYLLLDLLYLALQHVHKLPGRWVAVRVLLQCLNLLKTKKREKGFVTCFLISNGTAKVWSLFASTVFRQHENRTEIFAHLMSHFQQQTIQFFLAFVVCETIIHIVCGRSQITVICKRATLSKLYRVRSSTVISCIAPTLRQTQQRDHLQPENDHDLSLVNKQNTHHCAPQAGRCAQLTWPCSVVQTGVS